MPLGAHKAAIMGVSGVSTETVVLLYDTDHTNAASAAITSGIDSTYGEYIFGFYNINPATDSAKLTFQCSIDGGSNYNLPVTSTSFRGYHTEATGEHEAATLSYDTGQDQAQGTDYQIMSGVLGNGSDESVAGTLHLFSPASTTYVKHWYIRTQSYLPDNGNNDFFFAGYFNDADDDINAISFKMTSGNFDGTIKMWGVK